MSYDSKTAAMEGMFDPEMTATKMLEAVKTNVEKTVNTIDEACSLENKLSEEAAQFNNCLTTMANAIHKCERGEISREEMLAECKPCVTVLKEKCVALKLSDITLTDESDITEDEIAMLSEYITGCKDILARRKQQLQDCPCTATATESTGGILASLAMDPAMEAANLVKELRKSTEAKTANELHKQAKKLYSMGSKEKAKEYMTKAKKLYESCLKKVEENGRMYKVERTVAQGQKIGGFGSLAADKFERKVTNNLGIAQVIALFEDRVDSCQAYLLQWNNKAGKKDYKETKAQLKAERKEEKARIRAEKKEARAAAKAAKAEGASATESLIDPDDDLDPVVENFVISMESMLDSIELEGCLDFALEAEGDGETTGIGSKLRQLLSKFKRAKKEGDESTAREAKKEIEETTTEIIKEAEEAEDEAEVKKSNRNVQIALGVAAAAAAVGIGVFAARKQGIKTPGDAKAFIDMHREARSDAKQLKKDEKAYNLQQFGGDKKKAAEYANALKYARKNASKATNVSLAKKAKTGIMDIVEKAASRNDDIKYQQKLATMGKTDKKDVRAGMKAGKETAKAQRYVKNQQGKIAKEGMTEDDEAYESILGVLAFGLEGMVTPSEGCGDAGCDKVEPLEGKEFEEDEIIEDAIEALEDDEDLDELATEAVIAVMMAEDGIED